MAMATREHKRNIHGALLNNILCFKAAEKSAQPLTKMSGRSASVSVGADAMVCVECFRMKGDQDLKVPCQNPRCYFYLQVPGCDPQRDSVSPGPTFKKEVGYDRSSSGRVRPKPSDFLLSPGKRSSSSNSSNAQLLSNTWAFRPERSKGYMCGRPSQQSNKIRSQSISVGSSGTSANNNRGLSASVNHQVNVQSLMEIEKAKRKRMMSMPLVAGMESLMDGGDGDSLVEDAFLSSPLSEFATMVERPNPGVVGQKMICLSTPDTDTDSGIGSPFGVGKLSSTSSSGNEWMEAKHQARQLIDPSPHSACSSSSVYPVSPYRVTFDMNALKISDAPSTSCAPSVGSDASLNCCDSTGLSGSSSPDSANDLLRRFILQEEGRDILTPSPSKETYSRKVFLGGLPPDIDEDEIRSYFLRFGSVTVDWPHKSHSKGCIPPKGYAFLLFKEESSVHKLLLACTSEADKYFIYIPTSTFARKKVQIRPWYIVDSQHVVDKPQPLDSRKAVFVGGVPRPLKASELAEVMEEKYGNIMFVGIDCDNDLKYPKGAACVVFSSHASYIAAVSARFMQLNYGSLDKKIEIKPYVLENQVCDECHGVQCDGKPAPFFCGSVMCLQYYCEYCWATVHSMPGRQNHRPLLKDIGDRARYY